MADSAALPLISRDGVAAVVTRGAAIDRYPIPPIVGRRTARFGPAFGLTVVIWAVAWPFITLGFVNCYNSYAARWIHGLYQRKELLLARTLPAGKPRLIIVGGSNALFGIDAELIQQNLGVPTINYATHAGLGGPYTLYRARTVLRPGDSVLLSPEYELWYGPPDEMGEVEWEFVSSYDTGFLWSLGKRRALRILYSEPGDKYINAAFGWIAKYQSRYLLHGYDDGNLGPAGDMYYAPRRTTIYPFNRFPFPNIHDKRSTVAEFRQFAGWAREHQVRVFFSWPGCARPEPWPAPAARSTPPDLLALFTEMGFIVLDAPDECAYPRSWLYDTVYHVDGSCRRIHTQKLLRRLRPWYGLPPEPAEPRGIFLVGGGIERPNPLDQFTGGSGVVAKYLTVTPAGDADALTPADLPRLFHQGLPIWFDDPDVGNMVSDAGWQSVEVARERGSLASWLGQYDHHLFVLARSAVTGNDRQQPDLPAAVRDVLPTAGTAEAIIGTGPFSNVRRTAARIGPSKLEVNLPSLAGADCPELWISAQTHTAGPTAGARIRINGRIVASASPGEIAVVVIDPAEGVIVQAAAFKGADAKTLWSLRRLVRGPAAAAN